MNMTISKLRRQIACEAARLIFACQETDYYRAKLSAARRIGPGVVQQADLPTNREVRDEIEVWMRLHRDDAQQMQDEMQPLGRADRFLVYASLLRPLEQVKQNPQRHPEGDALYHSLQVFNLAREQLPYDEELLLAALLHDVGKAIDPRDHIRAGLDALDGSITPRTAWFIEHHADGQLLRAGTLGMRSTRRLTAHEDYDELMLLVECDRAGRVRGAQTPDLDEALDYLRELSQACDE